MEIKKIIAVDWQTAFPELTKFAQNKFYKIVGPLVTGIDLINIQLHEGYRPYFAIYPLWGNRIGNDVKACLDSPIINEDIKNRKGLQLNIPYKKHNNIFSEAVECVKKQIPIPFDKDVSLKKLIEVADTYANSPVIRYDAIWKAALQEFKFNASLYTGDSEQLDNIIKLIQQESKNWDIERFKIAFGNFDKWLETLKERVKHRETFIALIKSNKQDKKLQKLQSSELIS